MKAKCSPRIIETNERVVKKKIITCPSCGYVYEEMEVYVIPRVRDIVSKKKNGIEIADEQKIRDAENFYKMKGYLDEYYMRYVKLVGKWRKGDPIFEKKQRLFEAREKFTLRRVKDEITGETKQIYVCPHCATWTDANKALKTITRKENSQQINSSEMTHVIIDD